jgi:hypothetical protein
MYCSKTLVLLMALLLITINIKSMENGWMLSDVLSRRILVNGLAAPNLDQ